MQSPRKLLISLRIVNKSSASYRTEWLGGLRNTPCRGYQSRVHGKVGASTMNPKKNFLGVSSEKSRELAFKMTCASIASGVSSVSTMGIFYCVVCPIKPLICLSTFIAAFFSGALGALEGSASSGESTTSSSAGNKMDVGASSSSNSTSFGCVIGLATGLIAGYFTKSMEQPWRK